MAVMPVKETRTPAHGVVSNTVPLLERQRRLGADGRRRAVKAAVAGIAGLVKEGDIRQ